MSELLGFLGIGLALAVLVVLAYRGWSVLLLAPVTALLAAAFSGFPMLATLTQLFMVGAAGFVAQFFPLFLFGALFAKLMNDSGSVATIADFMTRMLGRNRAVLAVVLAGAVLTYGGISLFVAFFVMVPMAQALFDAAGIPRRLVPAAVILGTSSFTMTALPGSPAIQNVIPMPFFGTTLYAAPGLGAIAAVIMLGLGLAWLRHAEAAARRRAAADASPRGIGADRIREHSTTASTFDPAEIDRGAPSPARPSVAVAFVPVVVVVCANLLLSLVVLPAIDASFLSEPKWGGTTLAAVAGIWSVVVALALATLVLVVLNRGRLANLRDSVDAGCHAAVLPALNVASLVGFGAVIAALPAFAAIRDWLLDLGGGPLVSLAVATNLLAGLTGSATGGLTIALEALGPAYMDIAARTGTDPALMHRVAVIGAGTLDLLPHNGAVVTLLALCGTTHRESYLDIAVAGIANSMVALIVVILVASVTGSF